MWPVLMGYALGLAQGVRHAFEPDHLAAMSTVVAEQRSGRSSARYAALWGGGHAAMLLLVGGTMFALRREMPRQLADRFELLVALMLMALGVRAIRQAIHLGQRGAVVAHTHQHQAHAHASRGRHVHAFGLAVSLRPALIGVVHGLAGSGAMTALVASTMPSARSGILFIGLFGLGATMGMAALAGIAGVPLARVMRTRRGPQVLLGATGTFSLALGFAWGEPIVHALLAG